MIQNIYIPTNPALQQVVNFLSYVEITAEDKIQGCIAIFPNATSNLLISLDEKILINHNLTDSSIYASCSSTVAFRPYVGMKFMTAQFSSFGLFYLQGIPAYELHNTLIDLDTFFCGSEIERISNRLKEIDSIAEKFIELESFLNARVSLDSVDARLPYAIHSLKSEQDVTIDQLSASLCISSRRLQKIFKQYVGLTPSRYKKITRFNRASNLLLNGSKNSLTNVAYECGYYDQSHFIKDFRKFGGISPSEFLALKADSSDFYNYILKDIDNLGPNN